MTERPIIFSGPMVRAILEGRKTQTRRVVKPVRGFERHNICKPEMAADPWAVWWHGDVTDRVGCLQTCPYGIPGDRLWVKEATWVWCKQVPDGTTKTGRPQFRYVPVGQHVFYCADHPHKPTESIDDDPTHLWKYKTGRFIARLASRITLEVTDVRVQRVQEISEEDAVAEGCRAESDGMGDPPGEFTAKLDFAMLWDAINAKRGFGWDVNPWVWCISFRRIA